MSAQLKALVGIIFTVLTCVVLATVGMSDLGRVWGEASPSQGTAMDQRAAVLRGRQIEIGSGLFDLYCSSCHGKRGEGVRSVAPAINRSDLLDGTYEKNLGWPASVAAFLKSVITAGRPIQSRPDLYSSHMPTWSDAYQGPLRPDQVDALVSFILNWKQQAPQVDAWPLPTPTPTPTPGVTPTPAPTQAAVHATCQSIPSQYAGKQSPFNADDPAVLAAGKRTYDGKCAACHGPTGQGNGPDAASLNPKPADFTNKAFMQSLPVDCQLYRISEGVQGTGMPPWKALGESAIWQVLIYERSFSGIGLR